MSVARAQKEINAREFREWLAYEIIEPFGDDWLQAGTISAATQNVWAERQSQTVSPDYFIPNLSDSKQSQSDDEIEMILRSNLNRIGNRAKSKE